MRLSDLSKVTQPANGRVCLKALVSLRLVLEPLHISPLFLPGSIFGWFPRKRK